MQTHKYGDAPLHIACLPTALKQVKRVHHFNPDLATYGIEKLYGYNE